MIVNTHTRIGWQRAGLAGALLAGLAMGNSAYAASVPDAWITTKIKLALMTTEGVSSTDVNVDTIDGRVTLHGTVGSEQEKASAAKAAKAVEGVTEMRDMLAVVAPAKQDAVAIADAEIKTQVEAAVKNDKALADSSITVASVNKGVVVLTGEAASLSDHLAAVEDARAVGGVRQIASEIKSPDTLSDAEIWRDAKAPASTVVSSATSAMSDMWITTAAKVSLITNSETPGTAINVDTTRGVVTLFGMVPTEASKRASEAAVAKVSGVQKVRNQLQVVASPAQMAVKADDADIKVLIAKRLADAQMDHANFNVEVTDGVARLTGNVDRQSDRLRGLTIARATPGVRSVVDGIEITVQ
jgi:hyperosmotically inducible protein